EVFLDHVASNLGRNRRSEGVERPNWSVQPQYDIFAGLSKDELVIEFEHACEEIQTVYKRITLDKLNDTLTEVLKGYDAKIIVASSDHRNRQFGLNTVYNSLNKDGMEVHLWDEKLGKENQVVAERADVGISFS